MGAININHKKKRKFPSGKPLENIKIIKKDDPIYELEERFFKNYSKKKLY